MRKFPPVVDNSTENDQEAQVSGGTARLWGRWKSHPLGKVRRLLRRTARSVSLEGERPTSKVRRLAHQWAASPTCPVGVKGIHLSKSWSGRPKAQSLHNIGVVWQGFGLGR